MKKSIYREGEIVRRQELYLVGELRLNCVMTFGWMLRRLHGRHVRPIETRAGEEHVADERLDWRLADEPDEEELLDDLRRDGAQGGQPEQQLAETDRLIGVLGPAVLFERALRLLLQALDVAHVRQAARICCNKRKTNRFTLDVHDRENSHIDPLIMSFYKYSQVSCYSCYFARSMKLIER